MRKPGAEVFTEFLRQFRKRNQGFGLNQSVVPYLISGHPGCTLNDMIEVALYLKKHQLKVEQVQDFTPTPGSLSTCIYYTQKDPFTDHSIYVPRSDKEKRLQKALLLYHRPESKKDISEALRLCQRELVAEELFGSSPVKKARKEPLKKRRQNKKK
jgi:radical SAM superfamily enzyme YgiQ (UPF0313 family)